MEESEFTALAEAELLRIERALEECGLELDVMRQSGAVLEIEFEDESAMVINAHAAARELWLAGRGGAFHFRHQGGAWLDSRSGRELWAMLAELVGTQAGVKLKLEPPAS